MKKYFIALMTILIFPLGVFADGLEKNNITVEQKSSFASRAHITKNDFVVPTVIDVPLSVERDALDEVIVVDVDGNIMSSTVVSNIEYPPLMLTAENSFGGSTRAIVDGDYKTFVEFPFAEERVVTEQMTSVTDGYDNESRVQEKKSIISDENSVMIDIRANRTFKTDSFTLYFDNYITKPTHVRVVAVAEDGEERILLPEKFFTQNTVTFPEGNTNHYRINLKYTKPLRIGEIVFHEVNVPKTAQRFVRFIASPKMPYDIYFNTYEHVGVDRGELPNFSIEGNVQVVVPEYAKNNPLYKKADSDDDGVVDSADNCIDVQNPDQIDKDENGLGDACEDFDRDGIVNARDNCPEHANRSQVDTDRDGIGDVCDGEESRFMEKYPWIPYTAIIIVFLIIVTLIVKTLKKE